MIYAGGHLTILESVDSTNNYAMARVRSGMAKHGDAYFAKAQSAGKGQRGKSWVTERGNNIIISLVLGPQELLLHDQFRFSAGIALGVHDFFSKYAGDQTCVKWPNDIYWNDRKAGGVLIETVVSSRTAAVVIPNSSPDSQQDRLLNSDPRLPSPFFRWAVVGIGININQTIFPEQIRNPVSLKQITGKDWDIVDLAKELCVSVLNRFEQCKENGHWLTEYNQRLYKRDQLVKLRQGNRVFEATIKEVNAGGNIVVKHGTEEQFEFGTIEWVL